MATNYGTDVSTAQTNEDGLLDITPAFKLVTGRRAVAEAVLRLWSTPRGSLITDEGAGIDLVDWLNAGVDDSAIFALESMLANEAMRDERVASAEVDVTHDFATSTLTIRARIEPAEGDTFLLVVSASDLTLELLEPRA